MLDLWGWKTLEMDIFISALGNCEAQKILRVICVIHALGVQHTFLFDLLLGIIKYDF